MLRRNLDRSLRHHGTGSMNLARTIKTVLFYFIQWTWGLPQNIIGFFLMLFVKGKNVPLLFNRAFIITISEKCRHVISGNLSLGMFIFMNVEPDPQKHTAIAVHEFGHTVQSLIAGPLYLFIIGIPSFIWCKRYNKQKAYYNSHGVKYASRFPESSANRLGEHITGCKAIEW